VSNGNGTPEVLEYLRPWVDLWKVDLKGFDEHRYRQLGGRLQPVLDTIASLHGSGIWLEIVTLLVPGFNDSDEELRHLTGFIADVSRAIPWHVTAFHTDYRMDTTPRTSRAALHRAATIGGEAGLQFVYVGNLLQAGDLENTRCPECREVLIERSGFLVRRYGLTAAGCCPSCGTAVPGRWA
jgi:pyruvate formate lyase activating enzyme